MRNIPRKAKRKVEEWQTIPGREVGDKITDTEGREGTVIEIISPSGMIGTVRTVMVVKVEVWE